MEVIDIALSQCGPTSDRQVAIIDKNRDMYLAPVKHIGAAGKFVRLGILYTPITCNTAISTMAWLKRTKIADDRRKLLHNCNSSFRLSIYIFCYCCDS